MPNVLSYGQYICVGIYYPNPLVKFTLPSSIKQLESLKKKCQLTVITMNEELQLLYTLIPQENYIKNGRFMTKITHLSQNQNKQKTTPLKEFKYFPDHYCRNTETQQNADMQESAVYRKELTKNSVQL